MGHDTLHAPTALYISKEKNTNILFEIEKCVNKLHFNSVTPTSPDVNTNHFYIFLYIIPCS